MIQYIDNPCICGWYYVTNEGEAYGDGTYEQAEKTRENFIESMTWEII